MRFYVVETLKDMYRAGDHDKIVPKPLTGIFGATAGAVSVFGNTPLDVIKTRMQVCETLLMLHSGSVIKKILINNFY